MSATYRNLFLLFSLVVFCFALSLAEAQDDPDPMTLLRTPLVKLATAGRPENRFIWLDLNHTVNLSEKGEKISDTTQLFQGMYIGNQQFSRLVEKNGKPLRRRELEAEQKRYDEAVQRYNALDDVAKSRLFYMQAGELGLNLTASGMAQYQNTIAGSALLPFCRCVMIDSTPLPGAPQRKYRMWIDPAKEQLLRLDSTLLADEGQDMAGGSLTVLWTYIDGIPLVAKSHFDVMVRYGQKKVHVISDHTYSEFRRVADRRNGTMVETH